MQDTPRIGPFADMPEPVSTEGTRPKPSSSGVPGQVEPSGQGHASILDRQSPPEWLLKLVRDRHTHYIRLARLNAWLYYSFRVVAGLSAALLPFVLSVSRGAATGLAVVVAVTVVFDTVFKPRENWELYSRATDLLALEEAKLMGEYEKYKGIVESITAIEARKVDQLVGVKDILEKVREAGKSSST